MSELMRWRATYLFLLVALFVAGGCGTSPLHVRLAESVERPDKAVLVFLVDGMDLTMMEKLLKQGRLPTIDRMFVKGGVQVKRAIASIPAMTYPNTVSLMTGYFPGHHGIVGNQWFNGRSLESRDYITSKTYHLVNRDFTRPTIFEVLDDQFTVSIQCHTSRGATYAIDNYKLKGFAWGAGLFESIDQLAAAGIEDVAWAANRAGRWPSLTLMYFLGVDEIGHRFGSDSSAYENMLLNLDRQIARVEDALRRAKLLDRMSFVLVSDHGHLPAHRKRGFDLKGALQGIRTRRIHEGVIEGEDFAERLTALDSFDLQIIDGSHRRACLFYRCKPGWTNWSVVETQLDSAAQAAIAEDAAGLIKHEAVRLVCTKIDANTVKVATKGEELIASRRVEGDATTYKLTGSGENLGYGAAQGLPAGFACDAWHTSREWLAATANSDLPDFVPQIVEYFDSPRAGDLVVFTAEDWMFAGHGQGEHGSCVARDMCIPLFFAGPDIPKGGTIPCGRIVDVMPTVLELLGEGQRLKDRESIDGQSLVGELAACGTTTQAAR
jgi:arylsulfatase A-like enzyme